MNSSQHVSWEINLQALHQSQAQMLGDTFAQLVTSSWTTWHFISEYSDCFAHKSGNSEYCLKKLHEL
jgi:hypothetical protein